MARTVLTKSVATENNATAGVSLTMTAADTGNLNAFVCNGYDLIVAQNTGGVGYTVTITSAPDAMGRTKDIATEAIAASEIRIYGPFQGVGWRQTDGNIYLQASNAAVKFGVVQMLG